MIPTEAAVEPAASDVAPPDGAAEEAVPDTTSPDGAVEPAATDVIPFGEEGSMVTVSNPVGIPFGE